MHLVGHRLDVPAFLEAGDLFAFPSRQEGFGLVAVEAMAAGLPVVSAKLPSLEPLVDATPAIRMVTEDSADAFADGIAALLCDPVLRSQLSQAGQRYIEERWDVSASARRYEAVYLGLLDADTTALPASTR